MARSRALADEIQKIIIDVQRREELEHLTAELRLEREQLTALSTDLRNAAINQTQFDNLARGHAANDLTAEWRDFSAEQPVQAYRHFRTSAPVRHG